MFKEVLPNTAHESWKGIPDLKVSAYVCMYCMYARMHACMYVCMHVCMYVCMYHVCFLLSIDSTKNIQVS